MKQIDNQQLNLSTLLVNYNTAHLLPDVLDSLNRAYSGLNAETIIGDNASRDNSVELIKTKFPGCRLICNQHNIGFGRANNIGLEHANGRYVLLLNTDAFVSPDSLDKTIRYMDNHPACGILGVRLVGRDDVLQPSCRYFPTPWNLFLQRSGLSRFFPKTRGVDDMDWDHASVRSCDWVPGCFYLVRRAVIDQVGLFDTRYFLYYEEIDHCLAAKKAGWEVHYFPDTSVIHIGGESAKSDGNLTESGRQLEALQTESELLYFRKNHGLPALAAHVLLSSLSDTLNLLKAILKMKASAQWITYLQHNALVWKLFFITRFGCYPTK